MKSENFATSADESEVILSLTTKLCLTLSQPESTTPEIILHLVVPGILIRVPKAGGEMRAGG